MGLAEVLEHEAGEGPQDGGLCVEIAHCLVQTPSPDEFDERDGLLAVEQCGGAGGTEPANGDINI